MAAQEIFTVKMGGQAGQGIKSAGLMLAKVATRSGYYIYDYTEYPSLIRGGHNMMQINISKEEVMAPRKKTDLLIALNQDTMNRYAAELTKDSGVLYDGDANYDLSKLSSEVNKYPVPLAKIAKEAGGMELLSNTVALGASLALTGGKLDLLKDLIVQQFGKKSQEIIDINDKAAEGGYNYVKENFAGHMQSIIAPLENIQPKMIVTGNEAVAFAAIASGLQFAAIYPMTPTSNILHVFAAYQEKYGFIYKQPEDEISAITMAIGASYAGARVMTATSGGGFCLMSEGYGLAGMTETPIVIIEGMRGGPATGLPTWNEQGDLRFVLHAHQGEFPRIVMAAGDAKEAFELTMLAFNLADKYQTPVLVLVDKDLCEDDQSYPYFDISGYEINRGKFTTEKKEDYARYAYEEDGISTRTIPGVGNYFIANSDEHNTIGYSSEEIEDRNQQENKRMKKLQTCAAEDMPAPQLYGPENADITIVSWGSNKGSVLQAMKEFGNVNYLHLTWMNPFPTQAVKNILEKSKYIIDIELNFTAQLAGLIREKTGIDIQDKFLKYDGRPFFPEEIVEKIQKVIDANG